MSTPRCHGNFKKPMIGPVCYAGEAQAPQADALDTSNVISLLAKSGTAKTNGTRSGESNSKISVLIGGANAFASSTTDGTGQYTQLSCFPEGCSQSLRTVSSCNGHQGYPDVARALPRT